MKIPFLKNPVFLLFLIVPLFFGGICLHLGLEQMRRDHDRPARLSAGLAFSGGKGRS